MPKFEEILKKGYLKPYITMLQEAFPLYQWDLTSSWKDIMGTMLMGKWYWRPNQKGSPSFILIYFTEGEGVYYKDRLILSFELCPSQGSGIQQTVMGTSLEDPEKFIKGFRDEVLRESLWLMDANLNGMEKASAAYKKDPTDPIALGRMEDHYYLTEATLKLIKSFR